MKLSIAALFAPALALTAQDSTTPLKHEAWMRAFAILEDTRDGVWHLKGNVEIKTPICRNRSR